MKHRLRTQTTVRWVNSLHQQSDAELVRQAKRGSTKALDALVQRYALPLYSFIRALAGSSSLANELYQETWYRCFQALRTRYRERGHFRTWLFGIAVNVVRQSRQQSRTLPLDEDRFDTLVSQEHSEDEVVNGERKRYLYRAIARLPEPEREVVLLRLQSDLTFREIAEVLNKPLNTVLSHMHRAVKRLRSELKELA
ncbi:MAG: sigma-70 family RNA polymerase sigma factor [Calditrichaeota bacterium]|nr:sigma-70 family RNA polymerase sigma factor [Calditrichota bacterium]